MFICCFVLFAFGRSCQRYANPRDYNTHPAGGGSRAEAATGGGGRPMREQLAEARSEIQELKEQVRQQDSMIRQLLAEKSLSQPAPPPATTTTASCSLEGEGKSSQTTHTAAIS